jgi:glutamine synthetase
MVHKLEYVWLDGYDTPNIRSKTKVLKNNDVTVLLEDGSSTKQATGENSDCILKPVKIIKDPTRDGSSFLVLCEVFEADGKTPHKSNHRAKVREVMGLGGELLDPWFGFEQEYTLINVDTGRPLGFPYNINHHAKPQGEFYCGVGTEEVRGRDFVEEHLNVCMEAGLSICGVNAEVMIGQWEYQIGPLGALEVSDEIILSRYFLYKVSEKYGFSVTLHPKPVKGDWNGSGCHINYSTKFTREEGGYQNILELMPIFEKNHMKHIDVYGEDNHLRMTGKHETSSLEDFSYGISDRGSSIRIPVATKLDGKGYFEDRRPASNVNPYMGCEALLSTTIELLEKKALAN